MNADELEVKVCTKCFKTKPLPQFHRNAKAADGRTSACRECRSTRNREYLKTLRLAPDHDAKKNETNRRRAERRHFNKAQRLRERYRAAARRTYSGTIEEYAAYLEGRRQGWCCASSWAKQKKKEPPPRRNCKNCGFDSGTRMYCSDRCKYRWKYHNIPAFRSAEQARRMRRKFSRCDNLAAILRRVLKRGSGGEELPNLIGCDADTFYAHMVNQMPISMTADDLMSSDVHIDHIVERSRFDLNCDKDWSLCWHYKNLRPMWGQDNLRRKQKSHRPVEAASCGVSI